MTTACPRHGIIAAAADTPCPECGVALYDLDDRNARDVVRANRFTALKNRRFAFTMVTMAAGLVGACTVRLPISFTIMNVDIVPLIIGVALGKFLAEPFSRLIETDPELRSLDAWLRNNRI